MNSPNIICYLAIYFQLIPSKTVRAKSNPRSIAEQYLKPPELYHINSVKLLTKLESPSQRGDGMEYTILPSLTDNVAEKDNMFKESGFDESEEENGDEEKEDIESILCDNEAEGEVVKYSVEEFIMRKLETNKRAGHIVT